VLHFEHTTFTYIGLSVALLPPKVILSGVIVILENLCCGGITDVEITVPHLVQRPSFNPSSVHVASFIILYER